MTRHGPLATLALLLLVTGCAADPADPTTGSTREASAPPPTVEATTGSITGNVVDDEQLPVAGANVSIRDHAIAATTDAEGAFTFNGLAGATYVLIVQLIGYEPASRKVDVIEGQVAQTNIVLKGIAFKEEGYIVVIPRKTLVEFGQVFLDNRVPPSLTYCESCDHYLLVTPAPAAVQVDVTFTNGVPFPNDDCWLDLRINWGNATGSHSQNDGSSVGSGYYKDRTAMTISDSGIKALAKVDKVWYHSTGGVMPSVNRQISSWLSFAYHEALPGGYSALPPP